MRKLVTVRKVGNIRPIEGADAIVAATIDGWQVVTKKDEFQVGDSCVFFEIDSFLNAEDPRFEFLLKTGTKKAPDGKERIRLRSVKLRQTLSQGLALPLSLFPEVEQNPNLEDYSELLGVTKYERPEPKAPNAGGCFSPLLSKTDEERVQNVYKVLSEKYKDVLFVPTLKLDGTGCTYACFGANFKTEWKVEERVDSEGNKIQPKGIEVQFEDGYKFAEIQTFSRNLLLKVDEESHYFKPLYRESLDEKLVRMCHDYGESLAIQGEIIGPRIQGNPEGFTQFEFFAFNIWSIDKQEYLDYQKACQLLDQYGIQRVPELEAPFKVFERFGSVAEILDYADGESINAKIREGVVFKAIGIPETVSFKAISNNFLLKVEGKQ